MVDGHAVLKAVLTDLCDVLSGLASHPAQTSGKSSRGAVETTSTDVAVGVSMT
jgi:hypothetical protein